LRHRC